MTASKSKHSQMEESKISFITKTSDGTSSMCTSIFNTGRVTAVTAGCTSASCLGGQRWPAVSGGPFCFYGRRSFPAAPPLKREENSKLEKLEQHFHRIQYISAVSSVRGQKKSFWFTEKTSPDVAQQHEAAESRRNGGVRLDACWSEHITTVVDSTISCVTQMNVYPANRRASCLTLAALPVPHRLRLAEDEQRKRWVGLLLRWSVHQASFFCY